MFETLDQIEALLGTEEGVSMEFKSGLTLNDLNNGTRSELVKDVTALANAAGGTIIYGIAEQRTADGRSVADRLDPVVNQRITEDQLTMIIVSNTDPPLRGLKIRTVLVAQNSRVIVIDVEQADTAHQNRLDRRYYQRVGAISEPMYDFAIRDVMNRRKAPRIAVEVRLQRLRTDNEMHVYRVIPTIANEGLLTAHHWTMHFDVPEGIANVAGGGGGNVGRVGDIRHDGIAYNRFEYGTERERLGDTLRLLPGQSRLISQADGYGEVEIVIRQGDYARLVRSTPSLIWSLYVDDAQPRQDVIAFATWCVF